MLVAVETGDIVGSTQLTPELLTAANVALNECCLSLQYKTLGKFEVFRGDAYQVLYFHAKHALRHAVLTKLCLLTQLEQPVSLTQSLSIGELSNIPNNIGQCMAPVFVNSGRHLDTLKSGMISVEPSKLSSDFSLSMAFFNSLLQQLTRKQTTILYWYIKLDYPEHKVIAKQLGVTRQNVNTHLQRANADLVKALLSQYSLRISELS